MHHGTSILHDTSIVTMHIINGLQMPGCHRNNRSLCFSLPDSASPIDRDASPTGAGSGYYAEHPHYSAMPPPPHSHEAESPMSGPPPPITMSSPIDTHNMVSSTTTPDFMTAAGLGVSPGGIQQNYPGDYPTGPIKSESALPPAPSSPGMHWDNEPSKI